MFLTFTQFCVFVACVGYGGISGIILSISFALKFFLSNKFLKICSDTFALVLIGVIYILYAYKIGFPSLRAYMLFGIFLGMVAYMKSFHIILAKIFKKAYNILQKKKEKNKHERR